MTTATLHFFVRMPHDTRDTASSQVSATCKQSSALKLAREIDQIAGAFETHVKNGSLTVADLRFFESGGKVVPGHGVAVAYASGKRRFVTCRD